MMINPAPDVPDSLEDTNDLSKYSYNSDKPDAIGMHSENNLDDDGEVPEEEETESFQRPNLSDRYVRTTYILICLKKYELFANEFHVLNKQKLH